MSSSIVVGEQDGIACDLELVGFSAPSRPYEGADEEVKLWEVSGLMWILWYSMERGYF